MYVTTELEQITICFNEDGLETTMIQVPNPLVSAIVIAGVRYVEVAHEGRKIPSGGLDHEMKVIRHEHIRVGPHSVDRKRSLQFAKERFTIAVIFVDSPSFVSATCDVVGCIRVFDTKGACHAIY